VTPDVGLLQLFKVGLSVKGQVHSVKTSFYRQIIAFFSEIRVTVESDVRILIESCEIAVYAHAQYKISQLSQAQTAQND